MKFTRVSTVDQYFPTHYGLIYIGHTCNTCKYVLQVYFNGPGNANLRQQAI